MQETNKATSYKEFYRFYLIQMIEDDVLYYTNVSAYNYSNEENILLFRSCKPQAVVVAEKKIQILTTVKEKCDEEIKIYKKAIECQESTIIISKYREKKLELELERNGIIIEINELKEFIESNPIVKTLGSNNIKKVGTIGAKYIPKNSNINVDEFKRHSKDEFIMSYHKFSDIFKSYFYKCSEEIIQGRSLNLCEGLGTIKINVHKRSPLTKRVDFNATNKNKALGKDITVYYNDEDYIMSNWWKPKNTAIKNFEFYKFMVAQGDTSPTKKTLPFKYRIHKAVNEQPLLRTKYAVIR